MDHGRRHRRVGDAGRFHLRRLGASRHPRPACREPAKLKTHQAKSESASFFLLMRVALNNGVDATTAAALGFATGLWTGAGGFFDVVGDFTGVGAGDVVTGVGAGAGLVTGVGAAGSGASARTVFRFASRIFRSGSLTVPS